MKELTEDIVDGTKERTLWQCMGTGGKFLTVVLPTGWFVFVLVFAVRYFTSPGSVSNVWVIVLPTLALSVAVNVYFIGLRRRERERVAALQGASDIEVACPPRRRMNSRWAYINAVFVVVTSVMTLGWVGVVVGWDMAKELAPLVVVPALVFAFGMCLYASSLRRKEKAEKSVQINAEQEGQLE